MKDKQLTPRIEPPMHRSLISLPYLRAQGFDVAHQFAPGDVVAVVGHIVPMVVTECAFDGAHGLPVYVIEAQHGADREFVADEWRLTLWGAWLRTTLGDA